MNKQIKKYLIPKLELNCSKTIADAFRMINGVYGMVVTIIGKDGKLIGIVTEGDLRRAILRGNSIQTPLKEVMNTTPVFLNIEDLVDEAKYSKVIDLAYKKYNSGRGRQVAIPVVDNKFLVVGLVNPEILWDAKFHRDLQDNKKYGMPQVLVVGGAGFIGSVLVRMLLKDGWRVRVLDNMLYGQTSLDSIDNRKLSIIKGDVINIHNIVEAVEGIDAVVYLAELVGDPACAYKPETALKTNYLSVANMARLCTYLHISKFVYTSSCSVYGGSSNPDECLSEKSDLNPVSHYGRMKIMSETALRDISNPLFAPTILRLATVFGYSYRPRFDLVVNTFAKNAFFNKQIDVFGGDQWRPNVHVSDVAGAIIKVLVAPASSVSGQVFNVGSNACNHKINEIAELAKQVFPETLIKLSDNATDQRNYRVDFSKINQVLGFHADKSVLDGLKELKAVFQKAEITNPDDSRYSNIKALKELVDTEGGQ